MKTRNSNKNNYIVPDHSNDDKNIDGNFIVTTLDSMNTPDGNITENSDDSSYNSKKSTQSSEKHMDGMVSLVSEDVNTVLNDSIVPYAGNIHTVNVDETIDHPSKLKEVNNIEKYKKCEKS